MKQREGLTLIEVIVAMLLLAVLGLGMVSFMPMLTRNTQVSSNETVRSQTAIAIFEHIAHDWTNPGSWKNGAVYTEAGEASVEDFVASEMAGLGMNCHAETSYPSPEQERKRIIILCPSEGNLPEWEMRAEFGDPGA